MSLHYVRRTLISLPLKLEPSKLTNSSFFPFLSLFSSSFSTLVNPTAVPSSEIAKYLITHHKFSQETASKTSTFLTSLKDYKKSSLVLDFFREIGISNTQLEKLVLCDPRVLAFDSKNLNNVIREKIDRIRDLGFSDDDLTNLLCNVKGILTVPRSIDAVSSSISALQLVLGGSNPDVIKLLKTCNWFLVNDLSKTLIPNITLMENSGVSQSQVRRVLFTFPRLFLQKPVIIKDCMRRVDEMGLARNSNMYIHGVRVLNSMSLENWESKLKLFKNMGLSENDIMCVFRKSPQVFAISERKILQVSELLLSSGRVDITYLINNAYLLIYSPTARVKPRLDIIKVLLSKGLLVKEPTITNVCKMSDDNFIRKFVLPYADEVGEVGAKYLSSAGFRAS